MARVDVFSSPSALFDAAADAVTAIAHDAVAARGRFVIALSGGSTPRALYQRLAGPWRERIEWSRVHVFWSDERAVPPTHADSNYRMAREALLDHVPIPAAQVYRMPGDAAPEAAARAYEATLQTALPAEPGGEAGAFDLLLLGLGADAHTASLFPGAAAGRETSRLVAAEHVDDAHGWRLTLTPPLLNRARVTIWLVTGADKAAALAAVLEGPRDLERVPAQRISGYDVRWMVEREAARLLAPPMPD